MRTKPDLQYSTFFFHCSSFMTSRCFRHVCFTRNSKCLEFISTYNLIRTYCVQRFHRTRPRQRLRSHKHSLNLLLRLQYKLLYIATIKIDKEIMKTMPLRHLIEMHDLQRTCFIQNRSFYWRFYWRCFVFFVYKCFIQDRRGERGMFLSFFFILSRVSCVLTSLRVIPPHNN